MSVGGSSKSICFFFSISTEWKWFFQTSKVWKFWRYMVMRVDLRHGWRMRDLLDPGSKIKRLINLQKNEPTRNKHTCVNAGLWFGKSVEHVYYAAQSPTLGRRVFVRDEPLRREQFSPVITVRKMDGSFLPNGTRPLPLIGSLPAFVCLRGERLMTRAAAAAACFCAFLK